MVDGGWKTGRVEDWKNGWMEDGEWLMVDGRMEKWKIGGMEGWVIKWIEISIL